MTPYHTGKVSIGLLYTPAMPAIYGDALALQTALLDARSAARPGFFGRVFGAIVRWL